MSINFARHLRKNMPLPEVLLWKALKQTDYHFRRQVPREGYFLDFAELRHKLIVEVDGENHSADLTQRAKDKARDAHFINEGFLILRYSNVEIVENCEGVVEDILAHLKNLKPIF